MTDRLVELAKKAGIEIDRTMLESVDAQSYRLSVAHDLLRVVSFRHRLELELEVRPDWFRIWVDADDFVEACTFEDCVVKFMEQMR